MKRRLLMAMTMMLLYGIGIAQPASDFCGEEVRHFANNPESAVFLTITNVGANTILVEVESATASPVDALIIPGGSGAMISDENTSVPGKISRTLSWLIPPAEVSLNVLWSLEDFGGNWQLSEGNFIIPFAAVCPDVGPTSDFCAAEVRHFANNPESAALLTIKNVDANTMIVEIESATPSPVDLLIVTGGSGAAISGEIPSEGGKLSRTLTWATPPEEVTLNVLWSLEDFGGNWQLREAEFTVPFAATCPETPPMPDAQFCGGEVRHFANNPESAVFLTITNINPTMMLVSVESATDSPVDALIIPGGSGAMISDEITSVPGTIMRTLTWAVPPEEVSLNVLWSLEDFGGNWQLSEGNFTVPFAATCPMGPPVSEFCEAEVTHFAGNPQSAIFLTITNINSTMMMVEIESATDSPVDALIIPGGSGAMISDEIFQRGKIRRTLSWNAPPEEVSLNVLWSQEDFGGNWQLSEGNFTVPFAANCDVEMAIPTMGEWGLFYLAMIILILGIVCLPLFQNKLQFGMAGSTQTSTAFSLSSFPFEKDAFIKALKITLCIIPLGFAFIYGVWGEIIVDDLIGMALAIPLVAYLIYLIRR